MLCGGSVLASHALRRILEDAVADRGVAGASAIRRSGGAPESFWLPSADEEPQFLVYSITKTLTATCVLQLSDDGKLDLDDALSRWFPEVDRADDISLRRLLNHTSGVPDYGPMSRYHEAVRVSPSVPWSFRKYAAETFGRDLAFEPGDGWLYSNPGYMLLRAIVERVSNQTYTQFLTERIFGPLHLTQSFVPETVADLERLAPALTAMLSEQRCLLDVRMHYHPGWVSHGVVASTPSEIARLFDALFNGQLLATGSLAAMTELVPVPSHVVPGAAGRPGYGLGLMGDATRLAGPSWGHDGGGPGYQASTQHLAGLGATVCVMAGIERGFDVNEVVRRMLDTLVAETDGTNGG